MNPHQERLLWLKIQQKHVLKLILITLIQLSAVMIIIKDASKELTAAGSYEELFKTGFSFDTPDAIDLNLYERTFNQVKNGETVYSPYYDFVTCESKLDSVIKNRQKLYSMKVYTF